MDDIKPVLSLGIITLRWFLMLWGEMQQGVSIKLQQALVLPLGSCKADTPQEKCFFTFEHKFECKCWFFISEFQCCVAFVNVNGLKRTGKVILSSLVKLFILQPISFTAFFFLFIGGTEKIAAVRTTKSSVESVAFQG